MRAGKLVETIEIEWPASWTVNDAGTPVEDAQLVARLRAERVEFATEEFIRDRGASDENLVIFRIRFFDGITPACRAIWRGEAFNIRQVVPIGRRKGFELRCVRIAP